MRLTTQQINDFHEKGYLVVPNVLTHDEILFLRNRILEIFESGEWKKSPFNTAEVLAEVYTHYPEFIAVSLKKEVIEIITDLCNDTPVLLPETGIHYRFYTGWHKDTTSIAKAGEKFHLDEQCLLLQCGFYLQDNTPEFGGGLTVMEGSQNTDDPFIEGSIDHTFFDKIKFKLGLYSESKDKKINPHNHKIIDLRSRAGDFVIFNMKTNHRATNPANGNPETIPSEHSKLAFFNAFAANDFSSDEYIRYISSRPEPFYQSLQHRETDQELVHLATTLNFKVK